MISSFPEPEALVYHRPLPSGGYVLIATEKVPSPSRPTFRGRIVVERRSEARRVGHTAPVVETAEHGDIVALLAILMPVAESDELLAEKLAPRRRTTLARRRLFS